MLQMRFPRSLAGLSRSIVVGGLVAAFGLAPSMASAQTQPIRQFNVVPVTITSVVAQDGGLVANGVIGSNTFSAPIFVTVSPAKVAGACPILNLHLEPIHLALLGLEVDTSAICLDVTANAGQGLLGDLLCNIANLLNTGTPLATVLANLDTAALSRLNAGLTSLLNQAVFIPLASSPSLQAAECGILHLALGPVDLNLLGLRVQLDDCADGPVILDVTANPAGGLLGSLLCSLSNLLNRPIFANALLGFISKVIGVLVA
jgi:hypothetical protein